MNEIKKKTLKLSIYRPNNSDNLRYVHTLIINYMKEIGLHVEIQTFKRKIKNKIFTFTNLIGINPKCTGNLILLGAHTDSPQVEGCESAIDAATSISIILELVKQLLIKNPNANLILFFPDGEEALNGKWSENNTLSGSTYFVNTFNLNLIKEVYIFDLIGGNFNNKIICNDLNKFDDFYKLHILNKKYPKQIFLNPNSKTVSARHKTDSLPFFKKGMNTLTFIPNVFPKQHHTLQDNFQNINWEYVSIFYKIMLEFFKNKV